MNTFRTELFLKPSSTFIDHKSNLLTVGSCFSNSIGNKLKESKFNCLINPFGTVFNPISILKLIDLSIEGRLPSDDSYVFNEGVWKNHLFHSSFFAKTKVELEQIIKNSIDSVHNFLLTTNYLILTYGTSFVYERIDSNEVVANCHKEHASKFRKRLLYVAEIQESFSATYSKLHTFNPTIKIIATVSPVRHTRDTLELNSVSKSILRVITHNLKEQFNIDYFPAYEIMLDDLRDYRFYKSDMLHPSDEAIDYIWGKFSEKYFDQNTKQFLLQWKEISLAMNHKAFHPKSEAHQKFLKNIIKKLHELNSHTTVEEELKQLEALVRN